MQYADGYLSVNEISIDGGGKVVSFWATFEQHCEGQAPALIGDIRIQCHDDKPDDSLHLGSHQESLQRMSKAEARVSGSAKFGNGLTDRPATTRL